MKKLISLFLLTLAFLPFFLYAQDFYRLIAVQPMNGSSQINYLYQGARISNANPLVTDCPTTLGLSSSSQAVRCINRWLAENFVFTIVNQGDTVYTSYFDEAANRVVINGLTNARITHSANGTGTVPSKSCYSYEGAIIDSLHTTESPFCAQVGDTGGFNPQPLLCQSTCGEVCVGTSSGYQHYVSLNSCTEITGPDGGENGDGGGDTGGGDTGGGDTGGGDTGGGDTGGGGSTGGGSSGGGGSPVKLGGTFNNPDGTQTEVDLTLEQDFSPITNALNTTNNALSGIQSGINSANSKLDGIQQSADNLTATLQTGSFEGGQEYGSQTELPDATELTNNLDRVMDAINSPENTQLADNFSNIADGLNSFDSIQQIFDFAPTGCSPISFGRHQLNLCPAAAYSRSVLNWIISVLLIIFLVKSITSDLKRIRLT